MTETTSRYSEKAPSLGCKCGGHTFAGHTTKVEHGYPAHVDSGVCSGAIEPSRQSR